MEVAGPNEFKCMSVLNFHERGVNALAFSPDGKTLASVGIDNEHTLAVWDWEREKKITSTKGHSQKVSLSPSVWLFRRGFWLENFCNGRVGVTDTRRGLVGW